MKRSTWLQSVTRSIFYPHFLSAVSARRVRRLHGLVWIIAMTSPVLVGVNGTLPKDLCLDQTQIPLTECQALVDLFNSTNGGSWTTNTGWINTDTPCSWHGVSCASGHVSSISLAGNNLSGQIPESLGNLLSVESLVLNDNDLTGPIPKSLGNLSNATIVYLYRDNLSGQIPESLGNLSSVEYLILNDNNLTGSVPASLGNLSHLQFLELETNGLTGTVPLPVAAAAPNAPYCNFTENDPSLCMPNIPEYQALAMGGQICLIYLSDTCEPVVHVESKVLLEGPYAAGVMNPGTMFLDHCPSAQPYADPCFNGTALDHDSVVVVVSPPDSVLDWLLVSLRTDTPHASEVAGSERVAFLLTNGAIVDTTGGILAFPGITPGEYYLVVRHRNHASVMSADRLDLSDGIASWNFTTAMTQAYTGGGAPMKAFGDGSFGMFACDANADSQVTAPDFNLWNAATTAGETGYRQSDCNMDGQVTAPDFNLWNANTTAGATSQVPD